MKNIIVLTVLSFAVSTASAAVQKVEKAGCELDIPADWKVTHFGTSLSASAQPINAQLSIIKNSSGLAASKVSWKSLLKIRATIEDSNDKWFLEVEPDQAHKGMRSFAVFVANSVNGCMLNIHVRPGNVELANAIAKSMAMSK